MKTKLILIAIIANIICLEACKKKPETQTTTQIPTTLQPSILPFDQSGCGIEPLKITRNLTDKIINGEIAPSHKWPWMVSIRKKLTDFHVCGAAIISAQHILTAAHCINSDIKSYVIVVGNDKLDDPVDKYYQIYKALIHPDYVTVSDGNDLAVLILTEPIKYSKNLYSICLPKKSEPDLLIGTEVIATGWGSTTGLQYDLSNSLQQLKMEIKDQNYDQCKFYTLNYCVIGKYDPNANICYGDSGGPLMYKQKDGKFYIYGVASFVLLGSDGQKLCLSSRPSFFTKVAEKIDKIKLD